MALNREILSKPSTEPWTSLDPKIHSAPPKIRDFGTLVLLNVHYTHEGQTPKLSNYQSSSSLGPPLTNESFKPSLIRAKHFDCTEN